MLDLKYVEAFKALCCFLRRESVGCSWLVLFLEWNSSVCPQTLDNYSPHKCHWERTWCWEILRPRGEGIQRIRYLDCITYSMDMNLSKLWQIVKDRETWCAAVHGVTKSRTWLWLNNNITGLWIVRGLISHLRHAFILSESPEQLPLLAYQFWIITKKQLA